MVSKQQRQRQLARAHAERQAERRATQAQRRRRRRQVGGAVLAVLVVVGAVVLVTRLDDGSDTEATATETLPTETDVSEPTEPAAPSCEYRRDAELAPGVQLPPRRPDLAAGYTATLVTNRGEVPLQLDPAAAPCTVSAFVQLARDGLYDDTSCGRLSTGKIAGYLECGAVRTGFTVPTESTSPGAFETGTLVTVPGGVGSTAGFRLVTADSVLPGTGTAFGSVTGSGLRVLQRVADGGVAGGGDTGPPRQPVVVQSVEVRPS